jgi:hypothetical protein
LSSGERRCFSCLPPFPNRLGRNRAIFAHCPTSRRQANHMAIPGTLRALSRGSSSSISSLLKIILYTVQPRFAVGECYCRKHRVQAHCCTHGPSYSRDATTRHRPLANEANLPELIQGGMGVGVKLETAPRCCAGQRLHARAGGVSGTP